MNQLRQYVRKILQENVTNEEQEVMNLFFQEPAQGYELGMMLLEDQTLIDAMANIVQIGDFILGFNTGQRNLKEPFDSTPEWQEHWANRMKSLERLSKVKGAYERGQRNDKGESIPSKVEKLMMASMSGMDVLDWAQNMAKKHENINTIDEAIALAGDWEKSGVEGSWRDFTEVFAS